MVTQPEGLEGSLLGLPEGTDPRTRRPIEEFQPGQVAYLKRRGREVQQPAPLGGYREYKMTELQGIMAGIGLPYELGHRRHVAGELLLLARRPVGIPEHRRELPLANIDPDVLHAGAPRMIDTLLMVGKIPESAVGDPKLNLYGTQWTAPRFESVDPVKDAEAALKDIRMGRITWFEAVLANGYDPYAQLQQIALFNKLLDKFEIILDSDPRNTTLRGQEQPAATEERTPTSKAVPGGAKSRAWRHCRTRPGNGQGTSVGGSHQVARAWDSTTRTYLT